MDSGNFSHEQLDWIYSLNSEVEILEPEFQLNVCIFGVLNSVRPFLLRVLLAALVQRLTYFCASALTGGNGLLHSFDVLVSCVGIVLLWENAANAQTFSAYLIWTFSIVFLLSATNKSNSIGWITLVYGVIYLIICQIFFESTHFTSLRGSLIISQMKAISLSFDIQRVDKEQIKIENKPPLIMAYLLNPATLLFGPAIKYEQFLKSRSDPKITVSEILIVAQYLSLSVIFVMFSSCIGDFIAEQFSMFPFLLERFITAQSFRSSHYFVCYFALSMSILGGAIRIKHPNSRNSENNSEVSETTKWTHIEWPTSMADVVVYWNIPMNKFLKNYIFRQVKHLGLFPAIMITFGFSSLLHGFNFQFSAVLLSLGFYSFAEMKLRNRIASKLSLCLDPTVCLAYCGHRHKPKELGPQCVRILFVLLNIFHLIYLGCPFTNEGGSTGYSFDHAFKIWCYDFYFASPIISILTLLLSFII